MAVSEVRRAAGDQADSANHDHGSDGCPQDARETQQQRQGNARQDAVGESITDKCQAAQDDKSTNHPTGYRYKDPCHQGIDHEGIGGKWSDEYIHVQERF